MVGSQRGPFDGKIICKEGVNLCHVDQETRMTKSRKTSLYFRADPARIDTE
jgi:hypothetical protein